MSGAHSSIPPLHLIHNPLTVLEAQSSEDFDHLCKRLDQERLDQERFNKKQMDPGPKVVKNKPFQCCHWLNCGGLTAFICALFFVAALLYDTLYYEKLKWSPKDPGCKYKCGWKDVDTICIDASNNAVHQTWDYEDDTTKIAGALWLALGITATVLAAGTPVPAFMGWKWVASLLAGLAGCLAMAASILFMVLHECEMDGLPTFPPIPGVSIILAIVIASVLLGTAVIMAACPTRRKRKPRYYVPVHQDPRVMDV